MDFFDRLRRRPNGLRLFRRVVGVTASLQNVVKANDETGCAGEENGFIC